jgi:peptide/nickel transport system substrate-binding protein
MGSQSVNTKTKGRPTHRCLLVLSCLIVIGLFNSPVDAAHLLKVGLLEEPKTLNIWMAGDKWSGRVLSLIYQSLYIREPDKLALIPWLAEEDPVYDETTLSFTIKLRPAKWSDGSDFTSEDVAFTVRLVQEFKVPKYRFRWEVVKKIETPDKHTVKFYLKKPMAIFETRALTSAIVQKKQWTPIVEAARNSQKPLIALQNHRIVQPVGTGPFHIKEWRQGVYLFVGKNSHFFGSGRTISGYRLGPFIDGIIFKFFGTSDAAILALRKGTIEMYWWGIQPGYLAELEAEAGIELFSNKRSALYYWGFNLRKPPFNDISFRRAIATLIDKDFIVTRILQGHALHMDSIVPPSNKLWLCEDLPVYGSGLSRADRVKTAYHIMKNAGYSWQIPPVNDVGEVVPGKHLILPNGRPMPKMMILTPPADYDPLRAMSGVIIQEWIKELGISASARPMSMNALQAKVNSQRDFDAFILGYGQLDIDPDWLRRFFHSREDKMRGGNKSGYHNSEFDRVADESASAMNWEKRRQLIWKLQKIAARDLPYIPLYVPDLIEAVRKEKFTGWVEMVEGIGNLWSFCVLKPIHG